MPTPRAGYLSFQGNAHFVAENVQGPPEAHNLNIVSQPSLPLESSLPGIFISSAADSWNTASNFR